MSTTRKRLSNEARASRPALQEPGTSGTEMTSYFPEALRDYRAFILGPDGHVIDRTDMFCANDEAAKKRAKQLVNGHDVELWHHDRKLAEFKHEE
jgi:hypothetical protein